VTLALVLLAGVAVQRIATPSPADAQPYLQQIRAAAAQLPPGLGGWIAAESPVPPAAVSLLRPNVLISREYTDQAGRRAGWLFVNCGDARDLVGHYPPICYVNSGWVLSSQRARSWQVGSWTVPGVEYEMTTQPFRGRHPIIVMNTMIVPHAGFVPDMEVLRQVALPLTRRHWGATQIQVIVDASTPQHVRDEIFVSLLLAHRQLIEAVLNTQAVQSPRQTASAVSAGDRPLPLDQNRS
jgi:hypothetical protein